MENLKISLRLNSPLRIDRFSTIDSILCALYVAKRNDGQPLSREDLVNLPFMAKSADGYCGSIWFVPESERISLENRAIVKKPEYDYLNEHRAKPKNYSEGSGEFKCYNIWFETLTVKEIYFYARGDKTEIEELLSALKYVGKKTSIGLGEVESFKVEVIEQDKSLFLDEAQTIPSRPLSVKNFNIKSDRVAFYRAQVPYWDKALEACYLPCASLSEKDHAISGNKLSNEKASFLSACKFVFDELSSDTTHWRDSGLEEFMAKGDEIIDNNTTLRCAFTGEILPKGIKYANLEKTLGETFTDYAFVENTGFISEPVIWTLRNGVNSREKKLTLGFHLVDNTGIVYVMGANKSKTISKAIREARTPFNFCIKTTANNQHTVFKSKNSISPELIACQYGNETYYFGITEAEECLKEAEELIKKYPVYKNQLIQSPQVSGPMLPLKKEARAMGGELLDALSNFYKKYDKNVRAGAFLLTVGVGK